MTKIENAGSAIKKLNFEKLKSKSILNIQSQRKLPKPVQVESYSYRGEPLSIKKKRKLALPAQPAKQSAQTSKNFIIRDSPPKKPKSTVRSHFRFTSLDDKAWIIKNTKAIIYADILAVLPQQVHARLYCLDPIQKHQQTPQ